MLVNLGKSYGLCTRLTPAFQTRCAIVLLCALSTAVHTRESQFYLKVNASSTSAQPLPHFWRSTGFCPPKPHEESARFDLGQDMQHNLAYIAAVPHEGLQQVRIHWLLDLITVTSFVGRQPVFNFTNLDALLSLMLEVDLEPGFELMGNPSNIFTDFENTTQVYLWRDLIHQLAKRYIGMFGLERVSQWNFETWNEPDCRDFDNVKMSVQGFLNYYDACSEGLRMASTKLRFGGPGDGCERQTYGDALYEHVTGGQNFFTGETGVRIDFISLHKKGMGMSSTILAEEIAAWKSLSKNFPSLAHKPFYNDEGDPLVGWSKPREWRADTRYAAMVVKIIAQHQNTFIANEASPIPTYRLLSNDNGFLSYFPHQFTQRTLLARLQVNTTQPPHTHFLRKPVHSAMGLLALLGELQVPLTLTDGAGHRVGNLSSIGGLASLHRPVSDQPSDSWQISILVYHSEDTLPVFGVASLDLTVFSLPNATEWMAVVWTLNQTAGNPYAVWISMGSPSFPTPEQFQQLRHNEGPVISLRRRVTLETVKIPVLSLPLPSIQLVHVCAKPNRPPGGVGRVQVRNITRGQVLVTWSDSLIHSRCVLTFQVEFSRQSARGPYRMINQDNSIFTVFVFAPANTQPAGDHAVEGFYRVRAVDYWERPGPFSLPVPYPRARQETENQERS